MGFEKSLKKMFSTGSLKISKEYEVVGGGDVASPPKKQVSARKLLRKLSGSTRSAGSSLRRRFSFRSDKSGSNNNISLNGTFSESSSSSSTSNSGDGPIAKKSKRGKRMSLKKALKKTLSLSRLSKKKSDKKDESSFDESLSSKEDVHVLTEQERVEDLKLLLSEDAREDDKVAQSRELLSVEEKIEDKDPSLTPPAVMEDLDDEKADPKVDKTKSVPSSTKKGAVRTFGIAFLMISILALAGAHIPSIVNNGESPFFQTNMIPSPLVASIVDGTRKFFVTDAEPEEPEVVQKPKKFRWIKRLRSKK